MCEEKWENNLIPPMGTFNYDVYPCVPSFLKTYKVFKNPF